MEIIKNQPLAPFTTVKIGGPADIFITTSTTAEFVEVLSKSGPQTPPVILGNGSNVLISDRGIRGTVIKNLSSNIEYLPGNKVKVDSGTQLNLLIQDSISHYLSDLEEFAYIPSTIGGAIYGNIHGFNKSNFNKFIVDIDIFDLLTGKVINPPLPASNLKWDYDFSEFQLHPNWIILSSTLQLSSGNPVLSKKVVSDIISHKSQTQSLNSLGSVFKNPPGDSAGRIIDQELGLKGFRIGDAQISLFHANFILNLGKATASDYKAVIDVVREKAKTKLNLTLETEIKFLGNFS
jgi:UDP-N-acetylmuramate dehydrogenase